MNHAHNNNSNHNESHLSKSTPFVVPVTKKNLEMHINSNVSSASTSTIADAIPLPPQLQSKKIIKSPSIISSSSSIMMRRKQQQQQKQFNHENDDVISLRSGTASSIGARPSNKRKRLNHNNNGSVTGFKLIKGYRDEDDDYQGPGEGGGGGVYNDDEPYDDDMIDSVSTIMSETERNEYYKAAYEKYKQAELKDKNKANVGVINCKKEELLIKQNSNPKTMAIVLDHRNVDDLSPLSHIMTIGRKGSGKTSWNLTYLEMLVRKGLRRIIAFSATEKNNQVYETFGVPVEYIYYEYREDIVSEILWLQGKVIEKLKRKYNVTNIEALSDVILIRYVVVLVFDDLSFDAKTMNASKILREIACNGRHHLCFIDYLSQRWTDTPCAWRNQMDYFTIKEANGSELPNLYKNTFAYFNSTEQLQKAVLEYTDENKLLCCDGKSRSRDMKKMYFYTSYPYHKDIQYGPVQLDYGTWDSIKSELAKEFKRIQSNSKSLDVYNKIPQIGTYEVECDQTGNEDQNYDYEPNDRISSSSSQNGSRKRDRNNYENLIQAKAIQKAEGYGAATNVQQKLNVQQSRFSVIPPPPMRKLKTE